MLRAYKEINFKKSTLDVIDYCNEVIAEYQAQGLKLTLRQLYYQLVSRDVIPNKQQEYKKLGSALSNGRLTGLVDWSAIEDRGRVADVPTEFESLEDLIEVAVHSYKLPRMAGQDYYVELWVEKQALAGVLEPVARKWHIPLMVNKGYSSQSAMFEAAKRIDAKCRYSDEHYKAGLVSVQEAIILYLGDLDPSGEDMVRDIYDRLTMFLSNPLEDKSLGYQRPSPNGWNIDEAGDVQLFVEKLAITPEQVDEFKPPPNPAKLTDSRAEAYIKKFGRKSWEVDALQPTVLRDIIEESLQSYIDLDKVEAIKRQEARDIERLREITKQE